MTPLNQYLSVELSLARPTHPDSATPLLPTLALSGDVTFSVDMVVDDASKRVITKNASHTRTFSWAAGEPSGSVSLLFRGS